MLPAYCRKLLVPNKPCQPHANSSGVSFVYLRWRGDENRSNGLELPYGPGETLEVEEVRKQGHEVLIVPMHPRGLRLERMVLREMRWQAFEFTTPATTGMLSKEQVGLCRMLKIQSRGKIVES
jgi:hypothetical protein